MKKLLSLGLAVAMAAGLAACGTSDGSSSAATGENSSSGSSDGTITLRIMDSSDSTQERRKVWSSWSAIPRSRWNTPCFPAIS